MGISHHFISRFYLDKFTDPDTPKGQKPYTWTFDLDLQKWDKRRPRIIAKEKDYNTITDLQGNKNYEAESIVSKIESKAAYIINKKIEQRKTINLEDKANLSDFICLMSLRVPSTRDKLDKMTDWTLKQIASDSLKEEINKMGHDISELKINASKGMHLAAMLTAINGISNIIFNMNWSLLCAKKDIYFITSDNPYHMWNPKFKSSILGHGLRYKGIEVSLPLTREICLLATWKKDMSEYIDIPPNFVKDVNIRRIACAKKYIYSPRKIFEGNQSLKERIRWIDKEMCNKKNNRFKIF